MHVKVIRQKQQSGAALIVFVMLLVVAATTLLVSKLDQATSINYRNEISMKALQKAKEALLGVAVTYPDIYGNGPGFLPCPDTDLPGTTGYGSPNPPCGSFSASNYAIGLLPWEFIGLDDVRDSSGAPLLYAVNNNYRNNPVRSVIRMNSELAGEFGLDAVSDDIVAVLFSPGEPVCDQDRTNTSFIASDYLEDENADDPADTNFVSKGVTADCNDQVTFNDLVLPITRNELMSSIEKRVAQEVEIVLNKYRDSNGNSTIDSDEYYPWLSPYFDPRLSAYDSEVGITEGLLPIHFTNEEFITSFRLSWDFTGGAGISFNANPSNIQVTQAVLETNTLDITNGTCRWKNKVSSGDTSGGLNTVQCRGTVTQTGITWDVDIGFTNDISFDGTATVNNPTIDRTRTRDVVISTFQPDSVNIISAQAGAESGFVNVTAITNANLSLSGIKYDINTSIDEEEVPNWFVLNEWYRFVYVAYANGYAPGGINACVIGSCLTINGYSPTNSHGAVVLTAGKQLGTQNRANGLLSDYYELQNQSSGDFTFDVNSWPFSSTFNDQVRIIEP